MFSSKLIPDAMQRGKTQTRKQGCLVSGKRSLLEYDAGQDEEDITFILWPWKENRCVNGMFKKTDFG